MNTGLLDILAGRHDCRERLFPFENGAIRMNTPVVEGRVMWEVWLHKYFWAQVAKGEIGLDPVKLFRGERLN